MQWGELQRMGTYHNLATYLNHQHPSHLILEELYVIDTPATPLLFLRSCHLMFIRSAVIRLDSCIEKVPANPVGGAAST